MFHVATQTEKDKYTLIEQSTHLHSLVKKLAFTITPHSYVISFIISLAIALNDVYMQLRYDVYDVTVK